MSEIVVYTALAVVFSRHADDNEDADSSDTVEGGGVLWRPVADGAWTQLHLFLEMERDGTCDGTPCQQLMRNFRLVAWVLETGKVIVNDVLCAKCMWAPIDELLWQFTSADGHCYGFRFHSVEQAEECALVVGGVLNHVEEIRRLVKKMFETRTTTREFLTLLYDIGFFKLDSSRRSTMIESAHAAVASLKAQPDWSCTRRSVQPVYPKEPVSESTLASALRIADIPAAVSTTNDLNEDETRIIMTSTAKRSSSHHLLAQFTEVQKAAFQATHHRSTVTIDSDSSCEDSYESEGSDNVSEEGASMEKPSDLRKEATCRSSALDTSEISSAECQDSNGINDGVPKDHISMPYKTRQELHVTYNNDLARYEGLPWAWRRLNHQFGLPLEAIPKRHVIGYPKKIPAVLQMLKELLLANDGLLAEGIFRLAPDKEKCAEVKQAINDGIFTGCTDVHIIANLIKVWFRELPQSLFNVIPEKQIYRTCELKDPRTIISTIDTFPPLHASLVRWLLDLMVEVAKNEQHNKMTARNLAIVISPNLFSITSDNPMYALTMSQKVAEFTFVLLDARLRNLASNEVTATINARPLQASNATIR